MEIPKADVELARLKAVMPRVVLASGSPNRLELLRSAGIQVTVRPQDIDEDEPSGEPGPAVLSIARKKLEHYTKSNDFEPNSIALCMDTLVYFEGRFLGKPKDKNEAFSEISAFSGRKQEVYSGYCIYHPYKGILEGFDVSYVVFKDLSADDAKAYIDTGEWRGAAGGYRIQKTGYKLIDYIEGSWTNVIGMPVEAITKALET